MNCKPGDLAIYINSRWPGRIFEIVEAADFGFWKVRPRVGWDIADKNLRPIRDQPGEDEILRIAGKPADHKQPELTT